tara:strand:- start:37690 stop:38025 length:336 start_codon:yes stop_codon:yes gene_type:complete
MGASTFYQESWGKTPESAFWSAVRDAKWEHGHGGYTGTVAEKSEFVIIPVPEGKEPYQFASQLIDNGDPRVSDKWGPAGCIDLTETTRGYEKREGSSEDTPLYLFFGWASD